MKKTFVIITCIALIACRTNKIKTTAEQDKVSSADTINHNVTHIPFKEAKNYFVKNTFKDDSLANHKIISQNDFDAIFGMAATMSKQGKPTAIDFSKQYVLAIIEPVTNKAITLTVESLTQKEGNIILLYTKTEGEKQSFTTRPFLLLVINNEYTGNIIVQQN